MDRASFLADLPASWPGHMARREVSGYRSHFERRNRVWKSCWGALWRLFSWMAAARYRWVSASPARDRRPLNNYSSLAPLSIQFVRGVFQSVVPIGGTR